MKNVKIMLIAITIMAIAGGSLAFKALKFCTKLYCTDQAGVGSCTIERRGFTILQIDPTDQGAVSTCTTTNINPMQQDCSERRTFICE